MSEWTDEQDKKRRDRYSNLSIGGLIIRAAAAAVEDYDYRGSDQHFSELYQIGEEIDERLTKFATMVDKSDDT